MKRLVFLLLFLVTGCVPVKNLPKESTMSLQSKYSPAWPHGEISQIFDNIFMVTGTNIIIHDGMRIQSSRNMIIVRQDNELTLINSVRLSDEGLKSLEKLGKIKNIIRIGAFHGRDDAFYQDRYHALLWAYAKMDFSHGEVLDFDLRENKLPIANAELFTFTTTNFPEALIVLNTHDGILISCDSIKNWTKQDEYFDEQTFKLMKDGGSVGEAKIDATWLAAMNPSRDELEKIRALQFATLLSAHGEALKHRAKTAVNASIDVVMPKLKK